MKLNLIGKRAAIYGMQGSGKTTFVKGGILPQYPHHRVFDILHDYKGFRCYLAQNKDYTAGMIQEVNQFVSKCIRERGFNNLVVFDEVNRIAPARKPLCAGLRYLNDFNGPNHINIGLLTMARRPSQVNTDFTELAHFIISFMLDGKNDRRYMNDVRDGLGDIIADLRPHHFVIYNREDKSVTTYKPIKLKGKLK